MARIEQSATVNVPPEKAFDYLADVTRHIEWGSHLSSADKTSDGPVVVGSTFATVGKLFGTHEAEVKITELVPNQKITFESQDDSGHFRHEFIHLDPGRAQCGPAHPGEHEQIINQSAHALGRMGNDTQKPLSRRVEGGGGLLAEHLGKTVNVTQWRPQVMRD